MIIQRAPGRVIRELVDRAVAADVAVTELPRDEGPHHAAHMRRPDLPLRASQLVAAPPVAYPGRPRPRTRPPPA